MKSKNYIDSDGQSVAGMVVKTFTMDVNAISIMTNLCGLSAQKSNSKVLETALTKLVMDITDGGKAEISKVVSNIDVVGTKTADNSALLSTLSDVDGHEKKQIRCYLPPTLADAHAKLVFMLPGKYRYVLPALAIRSYAIDVWERVARGDETTYNPTDEAIVSSVKNAKSAPMAVMA